MADESSLAPGELLSAIESGSKKLHDLATGLSQRIVSFETWINSVPGRIETTYSIEERNSDISWRFLVRLHRSGKRWIVSFAYHSFDIHDDQEPDWRPAKEASIDTQIRVVRTLPKLLAKMVETQRAIAQQIEAAQAEFDGFSRDFGIQGEES